MARSKILTVEGVREFLDYNQETGEFTTRPRKIGSIQYHHGKPYKSVYACGKERLAHRIAWIWMTGELPPDGLVIDHINGDPTDNRWNNLRLATPSENQRNRARKNKNISSGLTGAYRVQQTKGRYNSKRKGKPWFSALGGKHLGRFSTKEEAHEAYRKVALELYGDFAPDRIKNSP